MGTDSRNGIGRREVLTGLGLAAAAAAGGTASAAAPKGDAAKWDHETDVVVVGSGAAAGAAAVTAASQGAQVMMIEKMPLTGGTTAKSGGVTWVPNNPLLQAKGIADPKEDALKYMVRYSFPNEYTPNSPTLGIPELQYRLLEAFYDHGAPAINHLDAVGAVKFKEFRMFFVDRPAPDYADHLPENKVPAGRAMEPAVGSGSTEGGNTLASMLEKWITAKNMPVLTDTRVTRIVKDNGRAVGVEATDADGRTLRIKARRGVVFGTGGFAHNTELIGLHQPPILGACAAPGSTGDFIAIAQEAGAAMGNLSSAWRTQVLVEAALENRVFGMTAFVLPGDSMLLVNKYGNRCVNEKRDYNDRTRAHFGFDPTREEYPNHLMFMIFDGRSLDAFGGSYPFPADKRESKFLIEAPTLDELAVQIGARLAKIEDRTGRVKLAPDFSANMKAAVERFNGYAVAGKDPEFDRGLHNYDREWHLLFSARRKGTTQPENSHPNITMHPLTQAGPYYAFILGPGALDTNSGPLINEKAQVLAPGQRPIPGLYGAGNCIAGPSRNAYYAGGGTIGMALTYGYIAGMNVVKEPLA